MRFDPKGHRVMTKVSHVLSRRGVLTAGIANAAALLLGGCDRLSEAPSFREFLAGAEGVTYRVQRLLFGRDALAREFTANQIAKTFRANGSQEEYRPATRS
jgi:hypothetical protein